MAMSIDKSWSAVILFTIILTGNLCLAAPSPQQLPREDPAAQEASPGSPPKSNGTMQLIFDDMDLITFIRQISELLNLTPLVIDPNVQGTVTVHSSKPMSKEEVLALFNLILKTNNVSLIEQSGIYRVVPISSAMRTGVDLIEHPIPDVPGQPPVQPRPAETESSEIPKISTNVIPVEFIPVRDLLEPVKLFMTEGGAIGSYDRLNMLILTDYSDNIERIIKIVRLLDSRFMDPDLIELIKIEHNASADVVADLQKMFGSGEKDSSTGISFVSLDRMNAIFVLASSKRGLEEVRRWIEILDTTTGRNIQNNVYIVKNSTASNIATLLSALYGGEQTSQTTMGTGAQESAGAGGSLSAGGSAFGGTTGQQRGSFGTFTDSTSLQSGNNQGGGMFGGGFFTGGQQLNPQFSTSRGISSVIIQAGEFSGLQDTIRLVVDDINNRLFIQSTAADYEFILEAIKSMDVMPRQVRIDASIYEVDLTDDLSLGVGVALRERTNGSSTTVALNPSVEGMPQGFSVVNVALIGNSQELISALNALREKTNVKILENPTVFAMDGKEAYITVGSEVPYPGTSYTQAVGGTTTSVQYRDTGVTLFVRPRISESGSITMDILQEVSGVGTSTSLGPTFTKSRVETTLIVKNGETVAIAGLIRDTNSWIRTGFPLISDIPILGSLFGQTTRNTRRSELVILITPHVVGNPDKFHEITREFKDSMRNIGKFSDEKDREKVENIKNAEEARKKEEERRLLEEEKQRRRENRE